jgi:hypothetical protein
MCTCAPGLLQCEQTLEIFCWETKIEHDQEISENETVFEVNFCINKWCSR